MEHETVEQRHRVFVALLYHLEALIEQRELTIDNARLQQCDT